MKLPDVGYIKKFTGSKDDPNIFFKFSSFTNPGDFYQFNLKSFHMNKLRGTSLGDPSIKMDDFKTD